MHLLSQQYLTPEGLSSCASLELVEFDSLDARIRALFHHSASLQEHGQPVLIVCHGAGEFKENYLEMASHLAARGIACLLLDMHGHGQSEGMSYHVSMKEWKADISAALDYLETRTDVNCDRLAAFGLSSGGTAILEAACEDSRLKALVTLDATVLNTLPFHISVAMRFLCIVGCLKRFFTGSDLLISIVSLLDDVPMASDPEINNRLRKDPGKLKAFQNFPMPGACEAFFVNTMRVVPTIKIPTLVIWGADDQLDPPSTAKKLHEALTCTKKLLILEGNGHVGHLDRNRHAVFQATAEWLLKHLF